MNVKNYENEIPLERLATLIFVELEDNKCEGLIKTHNIKQDQFIFEADTKKMVGKRFGDELKMGTNVRVRIARIDMLNRTIDFELVDIY